MTTDALVTAIQRRLTDISEQQHVLAVEKARLLEPLTPLRLGILAPDTAVAQLKAKGVTLRRLPPAPSADRRPRPTNTNIQGTTAELNALLNDPTAPVAWVAAWGTGWVGLGQDDGTASHDIAGFTFTFDDAREDEGTFLIDTSLLPYDQFALAVKDGGTPKWAIFLLPEKTVSGTWGFSTAAGDLSHFALFARDPITATPEPASLLLLGTGLTLVASRVRKRMKSHA